MRKLILVFAAIAISAGVYAQAGSTNSKASPQDLNNTQNQNLQNQQDLNKAQNQNLQNNQQDLNKTQNQTLQINPQDLNNNQNQNWQSNPVHSNSDGVYMQNGKIMKVKNGQRTILQDNEMTLSNGTKIMRDGTYIKRDGSKMTMTEGQHMDMEGNMLPAKTKRDKNMYLVPDTTRKREN